MESTSTPLYISSALLQWSNAADNVWVAKEELQQIRLKLEKLADLQVVELWEHLLFEHKKPGSNTYGNFQKDDCMIQLSLETNCGVFWFTHRLKCICFPCQAGRKQSKCLCNNCSWVHAVAEQTDASVSPKDFLVVLSVLGFHFQGWGQEFPYKMSTCTHLRPFEKKSRVLTITFP